MLRPLVPYPNPMLKFDRLRTPPGDGDVLIEPQASCWPEMIDRNLRRQREQCFDLAGAPVQAVRENTRAALHGPNHPDASSLVIACGHQPEFIHAGVWAKHVIVRHAADLLGAMGLDLVVDNDAPDSLGLRIPEVEADGGCRFREIAPAGHRPGTPYEGCPVLSGEMVSSWRDAVSAAMGERLTASMFPRFVRALLDAQSLRDYVDQHMAARGAVDALFGAELNERRVSEHFAGPFIADLLLNAGRFAAAYNQSLGEYRRAQRIRDVRRPLPDLACDAGRIEAALWAYRPGEPRRRLWVEPGHDRIILWADQEVVGALAPTELMADVTAGLASLRPWLIRPRALTLTLWTRLLACDLFVHGIGGAKYDRVTDGIFRRYYGCEPLEYACVTATLRLPLPRRAASTTDLAMARFKLRDVRYNPDRYLVNGPSDLLAKRRELVRQTVELRAAGAPRPVRHEVFCAIHLVNQRLLETAPGLPARMAGELERIKRELAGNMAVDSREYFYVLHSGDRLAALADRLREAAAITRPRR